MLKKPFSFNGRIRRLEYGLSYLLYFVTVMAFQFYFLANASAENVYGSMLFLIVLLPLVWIMLAQGCKRCHDRGNSGWYQLIPFYIFWMLFADSEHGENAYGLNPKGIGNVDEVATIGDYLQQ